MRDASTDPRGGSCDMLDKLPAWPLRPVEDRRSEISPLSSLTSPWCFAGALILIAAGSWLIVVLLRRAARSRASVEERLRFETLLSQLSAGLIHVPAAEIDQALEHSLGKVVGILGGDRGALDEYAGVGPRAHIFWTSPGVEALPRVLDATRFPWTVARLENDEVVRFSRTVELPEAAALDRATYERAGTRSHVSLPLRAGGPALGVLSLDAVHAERAWSDELVKRLRLLSEAFANALERRRMEVSLAERLAFEQMLSSLSTTFSAVSAIDFDREIQGGLRRVVNALDLDRGALIECSRDTILARVWTTDDEMRAGDFPWTMAQVQRGETIAWSRIDELPDQAAVDRRTARERGLTSQVALPLLVGETVVAGLVFAAVGAECGWKQDGLLQGLQIVGEVFANSLARTRGDLEMQRLRQELAHIGRVSAMGELTASLAHELNQPLTAILNNAEVAQHLLGSDVVDLVGIREILDDIVVDDQRATGIIQRLRRLLKKGDLEYVPLDLNEIVTEVARLVTSDAAVRTVSMRLTVAPDLPAVRGDRVQLQQVLLNLVLNGLDAMSASATSDRILGIRTFRDGEAFVGVAVQDSGLGIAAQDAEHIFEPLYTTKREGLGMGLAIARTIVGAHRGRLTARNNVDGGATFQFLLPVDKAATR
jgi:signal transduction histidine kinase